MPSSLRLRINLIGAIVLAAYSFMALLSYLQAARLWSGKHAPRANAFFDALGHKTGWGPLDSVLASDMAAILSYWMPAGLVSAAVLLLIHWLSRDRSLLDADIAGLVFRWAVSFAAVSVLAWPVFTQDMWLSAVWGRMAVAGINPYYTPFDARFLAGLPLDHFPMTMSYGPLWALVSAAVMALARDSALAAAILFKGLVAGAWLGSLLLIRRLTARRHALDQCLGLVVFGWLPVSILQSLSEGHNDIVMVFLALLWLHLLDARRAAAPVALAASAACKYVTAPLFALDLIHAVRVGRMSPWRYAGRLVLPALFVLGVFALFYRSPGFFEGALLINQWHFLQPRDAVGALARLSEHGLWPVAAAVTAVFPALALYYLIEAFRTPSQRNLAKSTVAAMALVCFAAVNHLWPWYLVWVLAPAALLPGWWLSRFATGVAIFAPFTLAFWWLPALEGDKDVAALAMYAGALLWTFATRGANAHRAAPNVLPGDAPADGGP